jgi:2-polyprenyl-6-methoxyphenol hydroxylase-like FAD-dependent oxidoreductase
MNAHGQHAIVIGGSMAGLLAARVLSDHFSHVTLIERDTMNDLPESRKGQPQTRHLHGLLASGLTTMTRYFPDLQDALQAHGAILGDMGADIRWHAFGGYRLQHTSGMVGVLMSRPLLEWQIRRRVVALPNVTVRDGCVVEHLLVTDNRARVTGVHIRRRDAEGESETLNADLVVDAAGRGSPTPRWLEALGYATPTVSVVQVGVGYATRVYRRMPGDLLGATAVMVSQDPPAGKRAGLLFPIEGDRWMVTLCGWASDHPSADEQGFLAFARSLPAPDVYNIISRAEPLSGIVTHKFPNSVRRHYEKLARFPEGYLVLGDSVCSFNPAYGQGMTSAALQAAALDDLLRARADLHGLAQPFFKRIAKIVAIPWQLAVGEDFRFPETQGRKAPGADLINRYVTLAHRATHTDPVVYDAFLKVMNLMQPPASLMRPRMVWRVLRHARTHHSQTYTQRAPELAGH